MISDKTDAFLEKIKKKLIIECNDDWELNIAFLRNAIRSAEDLFNSSLWIFDTYTDHKLAHAQNVVRLMYQLLDKMQVLEKLNSLELALCLLSAYYHDAGMFLTRPEKIQYLSQIRRNWQQNKGRGNIRDMALSREEFEELNDLQYYVRQNHGKFVSTKLQQVQEFGNWCLKWIWMMNGNRYNIEKELAVICASHNKSAEELEELLLKEQMGPTVNNVNYMFCCVSLRIADLLDFDQVRASQFRYYSAGLMASQLTKDEQYSKEEFQKHMQSCGFIIDRKDNTLVFRIRAQPRDPYFENKIRTFAGIARTEIVQSLDVLGRYTLRFTNNYSSRNDDFPLRIAAEIDTNGIVPIGYESGDYRFQASKREILQYFTGEELYSDRTVFLRELLQNAIDTCLFVRNTDGYEEGEEPHIEIVYWIEKGSRWLQITDNGAGMDKKIIQDYFLKVGASFYNSDLFSKTFDRLKKRSTFTAISRFGIGVLSCFMVSDHVEVVTRSRKITSSDGSLYYLQMLNSNDQYTLRRDSNVRSFPRRESLEVFENGYGTSIALKLKPDIGFSDEAIRERLKELVFLPEVNIDYCCVGRKECVWDDQISILFPEKRSIHQLTYSESENIIRYYNGPYTVDSLNFSPIHVFFEVLSLDIGKHCDDPDINGYLYVALIYDDTMTEGEQTTDWYSGFTFYRDNNRVVLTKNYQILVSTTLESANSLKVDFNQVKVYFNGILHTTAASKDKPFYSVCGNLALGGKHRPDVHVSRDGGARFSLYTLSLLNHAFRAAVRCLTSKNRHFRHIYDSIHLPTMLRSLEEIPTYSDMMKDSRIEELWLNERIIYTESGAMSIQEIKKYVSAYGEIHLKRAFNRKHITKVIGAYLIQKHLKIKARFRGRKMEMIAFGINSPGEWSEPLQAFPCLFFMEYEGTDHLRVEDYPYNINHPLSQTLIQLAEELKKSDNDRLDSYFQLLLNCLKVKYNKSDTLIQDLITPVNQVLEEIGSSTVITDRDFIINPEYEFDLWDELGFV